MSDGGKTGESRHGAAPAAAAGRHRVIRASAGTGKTYQLSTQYIAHLCRTPPERILATTFTRKAAGEILQRILLRLADAVLDEPRRAELAAALSEPDFSPERCTALFSTLTRSLHRVRVATLDSVFSRIAGSLSLELGLPPGWRLLDPGEDRPIRARAIELVLREGEHADLVQLVHLLSKGEASRGITGLIRHSIDKMYEAFLEATSAAWRPLDGPPLLTPQELREAIATLSVARLPADKRWEKARTDIVSAAEAGDWETLVKNGLVQKVLAGEETYCSKAIEAHIAGACRRLLQHAGGLECKILSGQLAAAHDLLTRFHDAYQRLKRQHGVLTFSDVTRRLAAELSAHEADGLAFRLDAALSHLLLDEFQDTSLQQWQVLEPFAKSVVGGEETSFFCVGDVKQAIYGWRGGVAEIFDTVTTRLSGLSEEALDASRRSAPPVIETVNQVFAAGSQFVVLRENESTAAEWSARFPQHTTVHSNLPGHACLRTAGPPDPGEKSDRAVLRHAAGYVREQLGALPPECTIGILTRTNNAVGCLIQELRKLGIEASEEGGNRLTDAASVQIVLSALRLADHPGDAIAGFHVGHSSLGPHLELPAEPDRATADQAAARIRRELLERGYGTVLYEWMHVLAGRCDARELNRLRQLVRLADGYGEFASLRPSEFVSYVEEEKVEDPRESRVRVMTVHKAKGLEFDVVVLPELDKPFLHNLQFAALQTEPTLPASRVCHYRKKQLQPLLPEDVREAYRQTTARQVREQLCVLYVALTRAKHALHLLVAADARSQISFAGILRAALAAGKGNAPDALLYECGDAAWYEKLPAEPVEPAAAAALPRETPPLRLAAADDGRRRGRDLIAPSQLAEARRLTIHEIIRAPDPRTRERGTLLHAWFEQIQWLDASPPTDEQLSQIARDRRIAGEWLDDCRNEFRRLMQHESIAGLLTRDAYLTSASRLFPAGLVSNDCRMEVLTERRFDVPAKEGILSGSIDRLVLFSRDGRPVAADILDYKSNVVRRDDPGAVARTVAHYAPQMAAYARAVGDMYELPPQAMTTRLVLLDVPRVATVIRSDS